MLDLEDRAALSSVVERYARLLCAVAEDAGERPLVIPSAEFFPDRFTGDEGSARRLVARMMLHAGLEDVPLTTRVVDESEPDSLQPREGGCASGCAAPLESLASTPRLVDDGDGFVLNLLSPELGHPVVLTTLVARALGCVLLAEALPPSAGIGVEAQAELIADYAAVALGFGPLLLEGAYIYSKGCGGPRVANVTRAGLAELAVITALFVEMGGHRARDATKELGATQADALGKALEWAKSNTELCHALKRDPERVAGGGYTLRDSKPWLVRLFGKKPKSTDDDIPEDLLRPRTMPAKARDAENDALAGLVAEALSATRTDAE